MSIDLLEAQAKEQLEELSGEKVFFELGAFGDFSSSLPVRVAKRQGASPLDLAKEWAKKIKVKGLEVRAEKGFLNFYLTRNQLIEELRSFEFEKQEKTVVVEYSSPNIAKPFSVGHLRSTIIGEALRRIYEFAGWTVYGLNFLGDWGTQFGKLMAAYKRWPVDLSKDPIKKLFELYVRFHKEETPELLEEAHEMFRKLEAGNEEAVALWTRFRELSLKEFERIYNLLEISPLEDVGESKWVKDGQKIAKELLEKGIAEKSEGAVVIPVPNKPPLILIKSDGTTIYSTRDLVAGKWRYEKYHPNVMLYVVGNDQKLHFEQLFYALKKIGVDSTLCHVNFGLVRLPEGKMSTRKGRVVFLEDVLNEAIEKVKNIMAERGIEDEETACIIGIGAVKFADLKTNRTRDVIFDWKMLNFEGETGPYVQYAAVRAKRIAEKFGLGSPGIDKESKGIARKLARFKLIVLRALDANRPDIIANYLLDLAKAFNEFYHDEKIGGVPEREWLASKVYTVLEKGLWLLGIRVPNRM